MKRCGECGRPMRPRTISKADAPGTVAVGAHGLCMSCIAKAGGAPAQIQGTVDTACVLVRTDLRPSTYQALARYAKEHGTTIGAVLSVMADRAVQRQRTPEPTIPRAPVDDIDRQIVELNAARISDNQIAQRIGLTQTSVSRRRRLLGLTSPTPRGGRPKVTR